MDNSWKLLDNANSWRNPSDMEGLRFIAECVAALTANSSFGEVLTLGALYAAGNAPYAAGVSSGWFGHFRFYVEAH